MDSKRKRNSVATGCCHSFIATSFTPAAIHTYAGVCSGILRYVKRVLIAGIGVSQAASPVLWAEDAGDIFNSAAYGIYLNTESGPVSLSPTSLSIPPSKRLDDVEALALDGSIDFYIKFQKPEVPLVDCIAASTVPDLQAVRVQPVIEPSQHPSVWNVTCKTPFDKTTVFLVHHDDGGVDQKYALTISAPAKSAPEKSASANRIEATGLISEDPANLLVEFQTGGDGARTIPPLSAIRSFIDPTQMDGVADARVAEDWVVRPPSGWAQRRAEDVLRLVLKWNDDNAKLNVLTQYLIAFPNSRLMDEVRTEIDRVQKTVRMELEPGRHNAGLPGNN